MGVKKDKEIEVLRYFGKILDWGLVTDQDIKDYFEWSEQGKNKDRLGLESDVKDGFQVLVAAKRWRHRHIEMYEEGVLEGTTPMDTILEDAPDSVREYLAKEMFSA